MSRIKVDTSAFAGQQLGTSGLRKPVFEAQKEHYIQNFIQSIVNVCDKKLGQVAGTTWVVGGDGRYLNDQATDWIFKILFANGVKRIITGHRGLISTPCASAMIRHYNAYAGIILTASHNPGGKDGDFGIKLNTSSGGPALPEISSAIYIESLKIQSYTYLPEINGLKFIDQVGEVKLSYEDNEYTIDVVDTPGLYLDLIIRRCFDLEMIRKLFRRGFTLYFDAFHGVSTIYAQKLFVEYFGLDPKCILHKELKDDFGGLHPDPNLVCAHDLVDLMIPKNMSDDGISDFGCACDGDGDRNMILGKRFFVTPSDSIAIIASIISKNPKCIPYFENNFKGVARSMPTSLGLDIVAKANGLNMYEVPTGWKFFGNLMDANMLSLCGEESFGTGCDIIREKDGLWAIFAWLSIIAWKSEEANRIVSVEEIVTDHWKQYGRNLYCRCDYEKINTTHANNLIDFLKETYIVSKTKFKNDSWELITCNEFNYTDPIDHSEANGQGLCFNFVNIISSDKCRIVYRLSGTGSVGATLRVYIERFTDNEKEFYGDSIDKLKDMMTMSTSFARLHELIHTIVPTVIT